MLKTRLNTKSGNQITLLYISFFALFILLNLLTLTSFPFVHSDESWLSGLSRHMMTTGELGITEPFFNAYPRKPHAIKTLFHLIQMLFISGFGYNIFAVRLMSCCFALFSLVLLMFYLRKTYEDKLHNIIALYVLATSAFFIYSGHFARQEIVLVFFMLLALNFYKNSRYHLLGITIGLSIGIHPNAFLLAVMFGSLCLVDLILKKKKLGSFLTVFFLVSGFAVVFVLLSLAMNINFAQDYYAYGSTLGVTSGISARFTNFFLYYYKLLSRISGTYYIPYVMGEFILYCILICIHIVGVIRGKNYEYLQNLVLCVALQIGFFIIGRYNANYYVFNTIIMVLMLRSVLHHETIKRLRTTLLILAGLISCFNIYSVEHTNYEESYKEYGEMIQTNLAPDNKVLANLNSEYFFDDGKLIDYRNLAYLNNTSIECYIEENEIEYILYSEEMDYIYRNPQWQILYGDMPYYDELQDYLNNQCELVCSFESPTYGMRIVRYMDDYPWEVRVYKTK